MSKSHSKDLRTKKFRPTEMARYAMEEAFATLKAFVHSTIEAAAMELYEDQLRDVEIICAKDS